MGDTATATFDVLARDVTGQKKFRLTGVPAQSSVGELVRGALARMGLGSRDHSGQELEYRARLEREGRQLHSAERVGDVLQRDDEIILTPRISAG
jgi:hypothetical protein